MAWARVVTLSLAIGLGATVPSSARDLGNFGEVFPIAEPDLLALIKAKISAMIADGGMERLTAEMQGKAQTYANRPKGLALPRATENRSFSLDLSIRVDHDLADQNGVVFAAAGTVVNPLAWSGFDKTILFIDGDDPDQVAWAVSQGNELDSLIVLTQGAPLDLSKTWGRRFWFDQSGILANRFQIARLPSRVTRADPVMRVDEVALPQDGSPSEAPTK